MKFDQLRTRVDYEVCDRPNRLAGLVRHTGFGSGNRTFTFSYRLQPDGNGTLVEWERPGTAVTVPLIGGWLERRYWQRIERKIVQSGQTSRDREP